MYMYSYEEYVYAYQLDCSLARTRVLALALLHFSGFLSRTKWFRKLLAETLLPCPLLLHIHGLLLAHNLPTLVVFEVLLCKTTTRVFRIPVHNLCARANCWDIFCHSILLSRFKRTTTIDCL
jgi:hypothetical protein